MKIVKIVIWSVFILAIVVGGTGFTHIPTFDQKSDNVAVQVSKHSQSINLFVTHGHCSTPFAGIVENLDVITAKREDQGNPLENMRISFEIDPNSFNVCASDDLTARIRTPGLFVGQCDEKITFKSMQVYTMGLDWYQVNGRLSIKGVEKDVKLFATGIRKSKDAMPSSLVLGGQLNLFDWGIDFDKIVIGESDSVPTKLMYINMTIDMS